jgi:hypothetical protein
LLGGLSKKLREGEELSSGPVRALCAARAQAGPGRYGL